MTPEELKRFSKIRKRKTLAVVIISIVVVLCIVYWMLPKSFDIDNSKIFDAAAVETQARSVIDLIHAEDYAALQEISIEAMQPAMTEALLSSAQEQIADDWGELENYGKIYMAEVRQRGQVYAVAEVSASYEYVNVTYLISFNPQMELAGLYMR